jgi:hypothetical protein
MKFYSKSYIMKIIRTMDNSGNSAGARTFKKGLQVLYVDEDSITKVYINTGQNSRHGVADCNLQGPS